MQGAYIDVRDQNGTDYNDEMRRKSVAHKTAQLQAVQGVGAPLQGAYIDVRDQNGAD